MHTLKNIETDNALKNFALFLKVLAFIVLLLSIVFIVYSLEIVSPLNYLNWKTIKDIREDLGVISAICFGFVIASFVFRTILKYLTVPKLKILESNLQKINFPNRIITLFKKLNLSIIRKLFIFLNKITTKIHIPLAIIGFSLICVHVYLAFAMGFKFKLGYIVGLIATVNLAILIFSGVFKIKHKLNKFHLYLGVSFIILMILHLITV